MHAAVAVLKGAPLGLNHDKEPRLKVSEVSDTVFASKRDKAIRIVWQVESERGLMQLFSVFLSLARATRMFNLSQFRTNSG